MTGQALGRGRRCYYRCRKSYSSGLGRTCTERYVPRDLLEHAVFEELVAVMTDPERLREEVERSFGSGQKELPQRNLKLELARVDDQQKRLARLFVTGEFPDELLQAEATRLHADRQRLAREFEAGRRDTAASPSADDILHLLPAVVERVASWDRTAEGEDLDLLLRALDVHVRANRERAVIEASVPLTESLQNPNLVTTVRTSA